MRLKKFIGNFTTESGVYEFAVTEYWMPDQEGPYTIHSSLIQYESIIATGTGSFGWGDVANNSDAASLVATAEPLLTHYDIFGNESLVGDVTFHVYRVGTETGAAYMSLWELYEGDDDEFEGTNDADFIIGAGPSDFHTQYFDMADLADWENNTNYTIATWLYRVDENDEGEHTNVKVSFQTWKFTVGEGESQTVITPEPIFGCKDEFAKNFNPDATDDDGSCIYLEPMRVVLTANQTTGDVPLSVAFVANVSQGRTPYEISWDFDDGTFAENLTSINHTFYTAGVYNVLLQVTDRDGDMLERGIQIIATEPPVIGNLTGFISHSGQLDPVNKDMVASVEFYGSANGGEGPYTFTWKFGDDTGESGATILHEYATSGEYTVELIIEDSAGRTLQLEESITIVKESDEGGGITPPLEEVDGGESNFDIYATSTGAIGLLLIFGMFGRKRRESFLDAERRKAHGEGSMWE